MRTTQRIILAATLAAVALLGVWAAQGFNIYTKTAYAVTVTDELFGTTSVVWKPGFQLGLDLAGTGIVLAAASAAGYWWYGRRTVNRQVYQ